MEGATKGSINFATVKQQTNIKMSTVMYGIRHKESGSWLTMTAMGGHFSFWEGAPMEDAARFETMEDAKYCIVAAIQDGVFPVGTCNILPIAEVLSCHGTTREGGQ
jgi:hypothetical protein